MSWDKSREAHLKQALEDTRTSHGSSYWAEFNRCPRAHHLAQTERLVPVGARPAYFGVGSLCHAVLRYIQEGVLSGEPAGARNWEDVIEYSCDRHDSVPEVLDEAHRLMRWYWAHWGLDNAGWPPSSRIVAVERFLRTPEESAFAIPHTGRADTILEVAGQLVIADTKTRSSSLPKDLASYQRKASTRPQFRSLAWMLREELKLDYVPSIWVNAICKLKTPKFERVFVPLSAAQVDMWAAVHRAAAERGTSDSHMNLYACAPEMGSECHYFTKCHGTEAEAAAGYRRESDDE